MKSKKITKSISKYLSENGKKGYQARIAKDPKAMQNMAKLPRKRLSTE